MKVSIVLNHHQLNVEHSDVQQVKAVIDDFYKVASEVPVFSDKKKATSIEDAAEKIAGSIAKNIKQNQTASEKPVKNEKHVQGISKVLPMVDGARTLHTPIGEKLAKEPQWKEGIKTVDGEPRYQAFYWCDCRKKAKKYIRKGARTLKCDSCGAEIIVEPATLEKQENGLPVRDVFGNFFIAREALASLM